jgi:shikimate 5-dehydrogenase
MSEILRWCEISDRTDEFAKVRFQILNEELRKAGLDTEFKLTVAEPTNLQEILDQARSTSAQIRFSGRLGKSVIPLLERLPSALVSLKACDSLVCENGDWWPRFFLVEGLNQTMATDAAALDLAGSVLILGATSEAKASVAALSRIGFSKMIITDPHEELGLAFVEELRRSYFGIKFQMVARNAVTQLPGVCSIAVNTLTASEDANSMAELAYFNFLKPGGFWLDLSIFPLNTALQSEASSVGASIISGARVLARTDFLWATSAFNVSIDFDSYAARLAANLAPA